LDWTAETGKLGQDIGTEQLGKESRDKRARKESQRIDGQNMIANRTTRTGQSGWDSRGRIVEIGQRDRNTRARQSGQVSLTSQPGQMNLDYAEWTGLPGYDYKHRISAGQP
jgi:hypothetical protein